MSPKWVTLVAVTIALGAVVWGGLWRAAWLRRAAQQSDALIQRNRATARQGMTTMDEQTRDRTTQRRNEHEHAHRSLRRSLQERDRKSDQGEEPQTRRFRRVS